MKKILIFSLAYYPKYVGGAEIAIKEITDRISSDDIEFHMVTNRFDFTLPKTEKVGNVTVHRIGPAFKNADIKKTHNIGFYFIKILFVPLAAIKAILLHRKNNFDGLWVMMTYMLFPVTLMHLMLVRIPYVLTLQEGDPFQYVFKRKHISIFKPLLYLGFRKAMVIQPISTFLGNWAHDMGFKGDVKLVPNAVNTAHFSKEYNDAELDELKMKLGKKDDNKFVITTSRLVKKNAVDDIIKALPLLSENIKFIILGTGPDEQMLLELAEHENVSKRVVFIGQVDHAEMPKYLKISDIFVRPSLSEGFGNSFVEAMAAGIPVVATPVGGIVDFLFDPERNPDKPSTGRFCNVNDPESLAEAVQKFIDNPEKTAEIVENARKLAIEKYDWNLIARDMREKVFAKILA